MSTAVRSIVSVVRLVAAVLLLAHCSADPGGSGSCLMDVACRAGTICVRGMCVPRGDGSVDGADVRADVHALSDASDIQSADVFMAPICPGADRCATDGITRSCWTGAPGRRGVGDCHDGIQTCAGGHWGSCVGQTAQAAEDDCNNPDHDQNCDGVAAGGCACVPGTSRPCFDGPMALAGTGVCVAGVQHCMGAGELGLWSRTCEGQVTPPCDYMTRPLDPNPTPHVETTASVLNDRLFVVSGLPGSTSNSCGCWNAAEMQVDVLDPTAPMGSQWSIAGTVNIPRGIYPRVVTVGCHLFLFGGTSSSTGGLVRTVERYDPDVDRWTALPPDADIPASIAAGGYAYSASLHGFFLTAAVIGTDVYVIAKPSGEMFVFDTITSRWRNTTAIGSPLAAMPGSCIFLEAVGVNDIEIPVIVASGCDTSSGGGFLEYDIAANHWAAPVAIPDGASLAEHATVATGSRVLTFGGDYASTGDRIIVYDTSTHTATMSPTHLTEGRSDHVAGVINGRFYLAGGIVPGTATSLVPAFEISGAP